MPTPGAIGKLRPLGVDEIALDTGSALGGWQHRNRSSTIPHCVEHLVSSGALGNLERVAAQDNTPSGHVGMVFSDSDVYKVLEAISWESVRGNLEQISDFASRTTGVVGQAQRDDGYLNSFVQGQHPEAAWRDLRWGHELYCAGHLLQASVAAQRTASVTGLAPIAGKLLEHLLGTFSVADDDGKLVGICGHPEIETALVEYFRSRGDERALRLAERQVALRGQSGVELPSSGVIDTRPFTLSYFLHHLPVRVRTTATGHAVRELYLQSGVVDVATETYDEELLAASEAIWEDLFWRKTYVTGAHGSRHRDESIGDAYELPSDRAYAETCAGIASFQWNWRLLLATGRHRYAEAMERVLWNTIAGAVSLRGTEFFYSNTLQLRTGHEHGDEDAPVTRLSWYSCACCPPNLARLLASIQAYLLTSDATGLQLQLPFSGAVSTVVPGGTAELALRTGHPFDGETEVTLLRCNSRAPFTISTRLPEWTEHGAVVARVNGAPAQVQWEDGYVSVRRVWAHSDVLAVSMTTPIRLLSASPRVDALRGCVALQRGPLVYCLEADDLDDGATVEDVTLDPEGACEPTTRVPAGLEGYVWGSRRPQRR